MENNNDIQKRMNDMVHKLTIILHTDDPNIGGSAMLGMIINNWVEVGDTLEEATDKFVKAFIFYKDQANERL